MKRSCSPARLFLWVLLYVLISSSSFSQIQLKFTGSPSITGTAGTVGAQYTYPNIGTTNGITIKGVIQIIAIDGAGLDNIDGPVSAGGTDNAFQPVIYGSKTSGNCWSIQFRISFFNASTNAPLVLSSFRASGIDIDGNGGTLREHNTFYVPYSYTLDNPTNLTVTANSGIYRFQAPATSYNGIALTQTNVAVTCLYNNTSSIDLSIGACCIGGNCSVAANSGRQHSINFYDAVSYSNPVVLPMKLSSFSATAQKEGIVLQWKTVEEINLESFIIQKSNDGINFADLATIAAEGAGFSYKYYDDQAVHGKTYYRLKSKDIDGKMNLSAVVYAVPLDSRYFETKTSAIATPDGFKLFINSTTAENLSISVFDSYGNTVGKFKQNIRKGSNVLLLNDNKITSKGIYFLHISSPSGKTQVCKVPRS